MHREHIFTSYDALLLTVCVYIRSVLALIRFPSLLVSLAGDEKENVHGQSERERDSESWRRSRRNETAKQQLERDARKRKKRKKKCAKNTRYYYTPVRQPSTIFFLLFLNSETQAFRRFACDAFNLRSNGLWSDASFLNNVFPCFVPTYS